MNLIEKIYGRLELYLREVKSSSLRKRLKYCGKSTKIDATCFVVSPEGLSIGDNTLIAPYTVIFAAFGVIIGENCLISSNCGISSCNHIQNSVNRPADSQKDKEFCKAVFIGNNVWIGMNVSILPGVSIGDNSIVGSGSVVTKSIPKNEIWVGNPAKLIKKLEI